MSTTRTVEEIRAELAAAKSVAAAALVARQNAVHPIWKFTFRPVDSRYDKIHDETIGIYRLEGKLMNTDHYNEVGKRIPDGGGMNYLYNVGTERLIMRLGGGRLWLSAGDGSFGDNVEALVELAGYIARKPSGGDVTDIVTKYIKS